MTDQPRVSRRTVLRGLGTAIALPWLEGLAPRRLFAEPKKPAGAGPGKPRLRTAFLYVPNGIDMEHWTPKAEGAKFDLPQILSPLEKFRDEILVLSGLAHDKARPLGDGPGDHARETATFLTGVHPRKTDGKDIQAGVSVDQLAAARIGDRTRFPSLELGCDRSAMSGNCDSGYSCAYSSNISWRTPSQPQAKETNPRLVFERMFGDPSQSAEARDRARREAIDRSILDQVRDDARSLRSRLGTSDQTKLDEYLESVRSIEQRIQSAGSTAAAPPPKPDMDPPSGSPSDFGEHVRLMLDLIAVAFQTDTTRIATFLYANAGSNRAYPFIDVREGHHTLSHHGGDPEKLEKIRKIDHFHVQQLAYFLGKLKGMKEGAGSLLDSCQIVYGSAIGDGNRHNHDNLPILLAGRAGGTIKPGRHVRFGKETPMCNLYLSMLDRIGVKEERFGDSTGRLADLA